MSEWLTRILLLVLVGAIVYLVGSYVLNTPAPSNSQITCMQTLRPAVGFWRATEMCAR